MTDLPISELDEVLIPAAGDLFAIVNAGETKKIDWSNLGFIRSIYGGIHVHDNAVAQAIATGVAYTKLTAFVDNGASNNMTPDAANDKITVTVAGNYLFNCSLNFFSGTANTIWWGAPFLGGVEYDAIHIQRKISNANDVGSASMSGIMQIPAVPTDVDIRLRHNNGGSVNVTLAYGNFSLVYVGA